MTAAQAGDEVARAALESVAARLAHGLANVVTVLLPERVVVGGGVAAAGDLLLGPLRRELARRAPLVPPDWYDVVPAAVGPLAGAVGAALFSAESGDAASSPPRKTHPIQAIPPGSPPSQWG